LPCRALAEELADALALQGACERLALPSASEKCLAKTRLLSQFHIIL
jgi:hypothetical protein